MSDLSLRIGDVCTKIYSGGTPKSTIPEYYTPGTIPWLNSGEVQFKPIFRTEKYISESGLVNSAAKWVYPPAVAVAMYGATAGNAAIVNTPLTTNQAICNLIIDSAKSDYRFVYYALMWLNESLASLTNGAAQQNLNAKTIADFCIPNLTLNAQRRIAAVLSAIDDKIELNRLLNDNLEAMAQALYDYWFVQFDFPDENGKPYKSSGGKMVWNSQIGQEIPDGWKVTKLADLIEPLVTGKLDAKASEDGGQYPFFTCSAAPLEINSFSFDEDAIILAGNGDFYIFDYNGKFDVYQRDYVIIPKEGESKQYLYLTIARNIRILKDKAQGSIIKFLTKGMIENIPVFALDWNCHQKLKRTLQNLFIKRFNVQKEIASLTKQRDFLLPLLMNGQVQVKPLNYRLADD